jgi:hypothetical protein
MATSVAGELKVTKVILGPSPKARSSNTVAYTVPTPTTEEDTYIENKAAPDS